MRSAGGLLVRVVSADERLVDRIRTFLEGSEAQMEVFDSPESMMAAPGPEDVGCVIFDVGTPPRAARHKGCGGEPASVEAPVIFVDGREHLDAAEGAAARSGDGDGAAAPLRRVIERTLARAREVAVARAEGCEARRFLAELTPRERQVLDHVVEGKSARQIAAELGISARTVEAHRAHAMEKLGAHSISELVRLVTECRMSPEGDLPEPATRPRRVRPRPLDPQARIG